MTNADPSLAPRKTTCPYCGVGCVVIATPDGGGGAIIAGDPDHPANFGRLCSKGSALGETLGLAGRLLHPMQRGARAPPAASDAAGRRRRPPPRELGHRARRRGGRLPPHRRPAWAGRGG